MKTLYLDSLLWAQGQITVFLPQFSEVGAPQRIHAPIRWGVVERSAFGDLIMDRGGGMQQGASKYVLQKNAENAKMQLEENYF